LTHNDTAGCKSLEVIEENVVIGCHDLDKFCFLATVRNVDRAFHLTARKVLDLSATQVTQSLDGVLPFRETLTLPRRCLLGHGYGCPDSALRTLTFGAVDDEDFFGFWRPRLVRFESVKSPVKPRLSDARVHAEVAAVMTRESRPFFPPRRCYASACDGFVPRRCGLCRIVSLHTSLLARLALLTIHRVSFWRDTSPLGPACQFDGR
jgi:hypothetical protein